VIASVVLGERFSPARKQEEFMYDEVVRFRFRMGDKVRYVPLPQHKYDYESHNNQELFVVRRSAHQSEPFGQWYIHYNLTRDSDGKGGFVMASESELEWAL
jgi:hypothetical protein